MNHSARVCDDCPTTFICNEARLFPVSFMNGYVKRKCKVRVVIFQERVHLAQSAFKIIFGLTRRVRYYANMQIKRLCALKTRLSRRYRIFSRDFGPQTAT